MHRRSRSKPCSRAKRASGSSRHSHTLPQEQRAAFLLYVEGGLSVAEIGEAAGVKPETAKSRLRYAVTRLKRLLGDAAPD